MQKHYCGKKINNKKATIICCKHWYIIKGSNKTLILKHKYRGNKQNQAQVTKLKM